MYRDLRAPAFQFLRNAFEEYLKENWWGLVCKRNRSFESQTVENHPRLTLENAARQAGTSTSLVRHLIQAELIPGVEEKLPSGRHLSSVHQNDVARISALAEGAMTLREAAAFLALPEQRVRELVIAGLLNPIVSRMTTNAAAWQFSKEQLSVLSNLQGAVQGKPRLVSFQQILKSWSLRKGEFPALVKVLKDRTLSGAIATPGSFRALCRTDDEWRLALSRENVEVAELPEADHTFSRAGDLESFNGHCCRWLAQQFGDRSCR